MNTCGNCCFWHVDAKDMRMGDCYGLPPTPLLTLAQLPNSQPALNIQMARPKLMRGEHVCSLYGAALAVPN